VERILEELRPGLGEAVSPAAGPGLIWVGTERDLAGLSGFDLAVVIDADGLIRAPSYRAEEEALRTLARVAAIVTRGRGKRCVVQPSAPDQDVVAALRRGEPLPLLRAQLKERERLGLPPAGEVLILEIVNPAPTTGPDLAEIMGEGEAFGPVQVGDRSRWLLQGQDLGRARIGLRRLVQQWRDGGSRVRIDADPLEL